MKKFLLTTLSAIAFLFAATAPALAGDPVVTRYFSGLWDQPHQESQGILLQVIDQEEDGSPKAVAYWFTYGDDMGTAWYMAIGHVEGNQVTMEMYSSGGVEFMQDASPEVNPVDPIGTLVLAFSNCNKGTAVYDMGEDNSGEFEIKRLASLYNSRCSGGVSDNTPGDAKPVMLDVELLPPIDGEDGKGKAKFWERSDRTDFHVSAEDLFDGVYEIHVCEGEYENPVGTLTVADGEGATQFRSPEAEGKELLTFDPRDCLIEIRQAGAVHLTSGDKVLGEKEKGPKDKDGEVSVELELENTGVSGFEDAEGEVEYSVDADEREFEVEIEDVPAGDYGLFVGPVGMQHGTITVNASGKGKLKLSDPQKEDRELLEFDPMGEIVEVRNADNVTILEVTFPDA